MTIPNQLPLLPIMQAEPPARRLALIVVLASIIIFAAVVPFAQVPLTPVAAFLPIYESALLVNDLITAVMLFGHFRILRSRAVLVLACGYLFTAVITIPHMLTFPGLFAPTGLLGAGAQSTAWIYAFWHAGFPLCVVAYAVMRQREAERPYLIRAPGIAILIGIVAAVAVAGVFTWLATVHHDRFPAMLAGGHYTPAGSISLTSTWVFSVVALLVLWRAKSRSLLDVSLLVVLCAWLLDIALSAVLNAGRFDVGWYAGRIYGLVASSCVLIVLLLENNKLYARLVVAHEHALRRTEDLQALNTQIEERATELKVARAYAEQANSAKSAFLASMSHELRTPLNAILGFGQILASTAMPLSEEKRKEFTVHILTAGKHLLALINEVLDLAKVESGTLSLSQEPVALHEVLATCKEMIKPMADQKNIRLMFPADAGMFVLADRTRLQQVLLNLLSNAVKYNRQGGAVVVGATTPSPQTIRVAVQDSGKGLDATQLGGLFQPFNRLGQETGTEEGTGIGLVVTKRLVELMGGSIGATSTVGAGCVFWLELKSSTAARIIDVKEVLKESGATSIAKTTAPSRTMLYVEDNPANLALVREIIAFRTDLHLITAVDALRGIALARLHQPAVILMDINLPGMDGNEAVALLRADPDTAHIPVIALSANAMPRDIATSMAAGFCRYLTKPLEVDGLFAALDSALASPEEVRNS